jgi:hypothetical protein
MFRICMLVSFRPSFLVSSMRIQYLPVLVNNYLKLFDFAIKSFIAPFSRVLTATSLLYPSRQGSWMRMDNGIGLSFQVPHPTGSEKFIFVLLKLYFSVGFVYIRWSPNIFLWLQFFIIFSKIFNLLFQSAQLSFFLL